MDRRELAELREIECEANDHAHQAMIQIHEEPERAQVHATLSAAKRVEALCYAIRHPPRSMVLSEEEER